ncbi:hypothetical protein T440DRAFT_517808 [Plenodomus tracheiphilus IPT5]|uniref:Uncharacterized protein n=1 Tax=Plenodomus tracheiphilus IPT5 TaxID=1408161 RepID=A0A6A7B9N2_9PLEO|nr:hypothetical protein T440DRAFT_517808 [Plenodomus tracheiphilus IPT5]
MFPKFPDLILPMVYLSFFHLTLASATTITIPTDPQAVGPATATSNGWSKEAILTLVGVLVAITCFVIGLAWPCIYRGVQNLRTGASASYQLRDFAEEARRYNEFLAFNAWREAQHRSS